MKKFIHKCTDCAEDEKQKEQVQIRVPELRTFLALAGKITADKDEEGHMEGVYDTINRPRYGTSDIPQIAIDYQKYQKELDIIKDGYSFYIHVKLRISLF